MRKCLLPLVTALLALLSACQPAALEAVSVPPSAPAAASAFQGGELSGQAIAPIVAGGRGNVAYEAGETYLAGGQAPLVAGAAGNVGADGAGNIAAPEAPTIPDSGLFEGPGVDWLIDTAPGATLPLAGATVVARDALTLKVLPFAAPVHTDHQGRFHVVGLPADVTMLVEVVWVGYDRTVVRLLGFTRCEADPARELTLSQASTLTAAHLFDGSANDPARLTRPSADALAAMVARTARSLAALPGPADRLAIALSVAAPSSGDVVLPESYDRSAFPALTEARRALEAADGTLAADLEAVARE